MTGFNDIPVEIILEIIQLLIPQNEFKTEVGGIAPWTSIAAYQKSLKKEVLSDLDESDPLPRSMVKISTYSDLLALRLFVHSLDFFVRSINKIDL
jgi:hypothetical protein